MRDEERVWEAMIQGHAQLAMAHVIGGRLVLLTIVAIAVDAWLRRG